jgi:DNA-binding winged helix-turn-helix (wHTH) protein
MSLVDQGPDASTTRRSGNRVVAFGMAAIVAILAVAAILLFLNLPSAQVFTARVDNIFTTYDLTKPGESPEIKLLNLLAQSGESFADVLASYQSIIFVLLVFATALLVASLVFLITIITLNRRVGEIERSGIQVRSLIVSRADGKVYLNSMEFALTSAAFETLAVLCEARMDDEFLTGVDLEAMISGKDRSDCEEAAGATRIKRLRDALGNQLVAELLVKTISRKGYTLAIDKTVIRMV